MTSQSREKDRPSLAQQAVCAHRAGDRQLLERVLAHCFSSGVRATDGKRLEGTPEELRGRPVTMYHQFPDRSVFETTFIYGEEGPDTDPRTADHTFRAPVICDRRCCGPIRHLRDPEAEVPFVDGSTPPRKAPPTSRAVYR